MKPFNDSDRGFTSKRKKLIEESETLDQLKKETNFEKGDYLALIVAAMITIIPVVAVILFLYYQISMFFFG